MRARSGVVVRTEGGVNGAVLTPKIEPLLYGFIERRCRKTAGVYLHGIGGTPTHVHAAVNIMQPAVSRTGWNGLTPTRKRKNEDGVTMNCEAV